MDPPQHQQQVGVLVQRPRTLPHCRYSSETQDWAIFRATFECAAQFYGYEDPQAKLALKYCMRDSAARAVGDIPLNNDDQTLGDVLDLYEARFMPNAQSSSAQAQFDLAKQGTRESILQWHARLRALYLRAYPGGIIDNALPIRRFALGLRRDNVMRQVLRERPEAFAEALACALNEESVIESTSPMYQVNMAKRSELKRNIDDPEPMEIGQMANNNTCFQCNKKGHFAKDCYQRKAKFQNPQKAAEKSNEDHQ